MLGLAAPDVDVAADLVFRDAHLGKRDRPQGLHACGEVGQLLRLLLGGGLSGDGPSPRLHGLDLVDGQLLQILRVRRSSPGGGGEQELVDAASGVDVLGLAGIDSLGQVLYRLSARHGGEPLALLQLRGGVGGAQRADERIAAAQVQAEPRGLELAGHGV